MDRGPADREREASSGAFSTLIERLASLAFQLCSDLLRFTYAIVRPFAPQLIPLVLVILVLPILVFVSLSAGFVVWKTSVVSWEEPIFLQYGDGRPPYADFALNIAASQPYDINLHLVVPVVDSNFALGNFMASLTLASTANRTITSIRRPSLMMRPRLKSLPWSSKKDFVELTIPLLSSYAVGVSRALVHIEIGRQDHWRSIGNGQGRELTVLRAALQGTVQHRGVRGIFSRFPLITASIASGTFFAITAVVVGIFLLSSTSLFSSYNPPEQAALVPVAELQDEKPLRRRSSKRKSRDFKLEPEDMDVPLADFEVNALRRRSSRQLAEGDAS